MTLKADHKLLRSAFFISLNYQFFFIWLYKNIVINSHFTPPLSKKTIANLNCNHSFRGSLTFLDDVTSNIFLTVAMVQLFTSLRETLISLTGMICLLGN